MAPDEVDGLETKVPKIIPDLITAENLLRSTEVVGEFVNIFAPTNVVLSLILGGSMQFLFGMVRAMQLITLSGLVEVQLPPHTQVFLIGCMTISTLDIFDGSGLYREMFSFSDTTPLNSNYEFLGVDTSNFMLNSGSFFIFVAIIIGQWFAKWVTNRLMLCCWHSRLAQNMGEVVYDGSSLRSLCMAQIKLAIEAYLDMTLATALNCVYFVRNPHAFQAIGGSFGEMLNAVLMFANIAVIVALPLFVLRQITKNFKTLKTSSTRKRIGFLYEGLRVDTKAAALYSFWFICRRLTIVGVLVLIPAFPFF